MVDLKRPAIATCNVCNREFQTHEYGYLNSRKEAIWMKPGICNPCHDHRESREECEREIATQLASSWRQRCPQEYLETRETELQQPQWEKCLEWLNKIDLLHRGLVLGGAPRKTKTRCAWMLIKRVHFALRRRWLHYLWSSLARDLGAAYSESTSKAREILLQVETVPVLFLDDISHDVPTERIANSLKEILEERTSNRRITIITMNSDGDAVAKRYGAYGEPIRGRIRDYFDHITF